MNQPINQSDAEPRDCFAVLSAAAALFGVGVDRTRVKLDDGRTLTRRVRAFHLGHEIELLADDELIILDVEADYGQFTLFYINPRKRRAVEPILTIEVGGRVYRGFSYPRELTPAQSSLVESGILRDLLEVIDPQDGEEINVSQKLVRVYLLKPDKERVMAVIHAVIDLMPHERTTKERYADLPVVLRPLIPLVAEWGIADDEERWQKIKRSRHSTREKLIKTVKPLLPALNEYLDGFKGHPPTPACELWDVAQAALEAQRLISENPPN